MLTQMTKNMVLMPVHCRMPDTTMPTENQRQSAATRYKFMIVKMMTPMYCAMHPPSSSAS